MQLRAKKIKVIYASAFYSFIVAFASLAQTPPNDISSPPASPEITQNSSLAPNEASKRPSSDPTSSAIDGIYDKKPQDGSAAQKANDISERVKDKTIADNLLPSGPLQDEDIKARFEKFLATSPVPQKQLNDYSAIVQKIEELLRSHQVFEAWKQLYVIAQYPLIDGGIGRELANRIEAVWNAGQTTTQIQTRNRQLSQEIKTASRNADIMSDTVRQKEQDNARLMRSYQGGNRAQRRNGNIPQVEQTGVSANGPETPPDPSALMGKLALTDEYLRSLEGRARIKLNELKAERLLDQVKKEFSDYVASLYSEGFYTHVVLAADFYRRLFNEGDYPVAMAKQVNSALEKSRDVSATVDVFEYKMTRSELASATDRLAEGFIASSYHPSLLALNREEKQKIANYIAQLDTMRNLVETRDYGGVEELSAEIKSAAKDFDTTKPMALVNAAKLESQLRLGKAKLLAQQGKTEESMVEFQAAAQSWPSNPDLKAKAGVFFETQDVMNQSLVEFDRLIEEQNYRAIFDRQVAFAPTIRGDKKREAAFEKALTTIKGAEIASEKAKTLLINGDVIGAWESVEIAADTLPDDQKLNKLRADLAGRSAEFANALSRAKEAEQKHNLGYALTWYVNAQHQYPPSQIANTGIARVSKEILMPQTSSL